MNLPETDTDLMLSEAVFEGLSQLPKKLPSWIFYDEQGDKIFQEIMKIPEYYLTRCELQILELNKDLLLEHFKQNTDSFELIELGAGDGTKTEILLEHFIARGASFSYRPVDISDNVLEVLKTRLKASIPTLEVQPIVGRYESALIHDLSEKRKVFLFMGANIGNFEKEEALDFVKSIADKMEENDLLMIGFDLKKSKEIILAAYDDATGITASFNYNMLDRLNRELGATFILNTFRHKATYDQSNGETRSYLVSNIEQSVFIEKLNTSFHFHKDEMICTEISLKYDQQMIKEMASKTGLQIVSQFDDPNHYFCNVLFRVG